MMNFTIWFDAIRFLTGHIGITGNYVGFLKFGIKNYWVYSVLYEACYSIEYTDCEIRNHCSESFKFFIAF